MKAIKFSILVTLVISLNSCNKEELKYVDKPNFITSDIDLFWKIFDSSMDKSTIDFKNLYVNEGTTGLKDMETIKSISQSIKVNLSKPDYLNYYNSIKANTLDYSKEIKIAEQVFFKLKEIHKNTKFIDVYFMVGGMQAGGKVSNNGLLIGVELLSKGTNTDLNKLSQWYQSVVKEKKYLPSVIVHELMHAQQKKNNDLSVLGLSIREGMADFISAHLLKNQPFINDYLHVYGNVKEERIWNEFNIEKNKIYSDTEWLYTGKETRYAHPPDMGYYVGLKIIESYSKKFDSVEKAIVAMLCTNDYEEILKKSGYADKFK